MLSLTVIADEIRADIESDPWKDEHSVYVEDFLDAEGINRVAPERSQWVRFRLSDGSEIGIVISRTRE